MQYVKLQLPPGVARQGTEYAVQGRYFDANLMRWHQGVIQPVGGWRQFSDSTLTGKPRAMMTWVTNSNTIFAFVGTHSNAYVLTQSGVVTDITPTSGFTTGRADAESGGGYGASTYGTGTYGDPRPNTSVVNPATIWTVDQFGQLPIACAETDGTIWEWDLNTANNLVAVTNAPTGNAAVMVTNDLFVFALGASSNPRKVAWCDRANRTDWTPSATNLAGDVELKTNGKIRCGKRIRGGELIFTDVDVHLARYVGKPSVYVFDQVGEACGVISQGSVATVANRAYWMGQNGFFVYDGYTKPLRCDVLEYVFNNLNTQQQSKVVAVHNTEFNEIWWYYPCGDSTECDCYVYYNYVDDHWGIGTLTRLSGAPKGVFGNLLLAGDDGYIYEHEITQSRDNRDATLRAAPIELGNGERYMYAREYVPDEGTVGDSTIRFFTRLYPQATENTHGPFTSASPKLVRFSGRQVGWEYTIASGTDGRIGVPRLKVTPGGAR